MSMQDEATHTHTDLEHTAPALSDEATGTATSPSATARKRRAAAKTAAPSAATTTEAAAAPTEATATGAAAASDATASSSAAADPGAASGAGAHAGGAGGTSKRGRGSKSGGGKHTAAATAGGATTGRTSSHGTTKTAAPKTDEEPATGTTKAGTGAEGAGSAGSAERAGSAGKTSNGQAKGTKRSTKKNTSASIEAARRSFYNPLPNVDKAQNDAAAKASQGAAKQTRSRTTPDAETPTKEKTPTSGSSATVAPAADRTADLASDAAATQGFGEGTATTNTAPDAATGTDDNVNASESIAAAGTTPAATTPSLDAAAADPSKPASTSGTAGKRTRERSKRGLSSKRTVLGDSPTSTADASRSLDDGASTNAAPTGAGASAAADTTPTGKAPADPGSTPTTTPTGSTAPSTSASASASAVDAAAAAAAGFAATVTRRRNRREHTDDPHEHAQAQTQALPEGAQVVFGNAVDERAYQKALAKRDKLLKKLGLDAADEGAEGTGDADHRLAIEEAPVLGARLDVRRLVPAATATTSAPRDDAAREKAGAEPLADDTAPQRANGLPTDSLSPAVAAALEADLAHAAGLDAATVDVYADAQRVAKARRTEARALEAAETAAQAAETARAAARDVWLQRTAEASADAAATVAHDARKVAEDVAAAVGVTLAPQLPYAAAPAAKPLGKPLVIGVLNDDTGSIRRALAVASAAHAIGLVPYWFDPFAFAESPAARLARAQRAQRERDEATARNLPAFMGNALSRRADDAACRLPRAAVDGQNAQLAAPLFAGLPADVPFVGVSAPVSQAAVGAGLRHVVNVVPDNRPLAAHLAEGALHVTQTPSSALGYKMLRGMDRTRPLSPMPQDGVVCAGHVVDHELVMGIPADCAARYARMEHGAPVRYLVSLEGEPDAAPDETVVQVLERLAGLARAGEAVLLVSVGTRRAAWAALVERIPLLNAAQLHDGDFAETEALAAGAMTAAQLRGTRPEDVDSPAAPDLGGALAGIHAFLTDDPLCAVAVPTVLMRVTDVLVTRPNELVYYPVPKLVLPRAAGPDAWNALRCSEVGDGTYELAGAPEALAMIDALQDDRTLVASMCECIRQTDKTRTYDGAYKVVQLAMGM